MSGAVAAAPGGLRHHWRILRSAVAYEYKKAAAFKAGFIVRELIHGIERPIIMIFVYKAIFVSSGAAAIGTYGEADLIAYMLLGATLWKLVFPERGLDLAEQIFEGFITKFLIMPLRFFLMMLGRFVQYSSLQLLIASTFWLLGLLIAPAIWPRPVSAVAVAQALTLVLLGSYCYFLLIVVLNTMAFWLDVVWTLLVMVRFIVGFCAGQLLPLALMPGFLKTTLPWFFPYWMLCAPVEILLGRLGGADFQRGLLTLIAWTLALQLLAAATWRRGLRRYTGVGQ
ncbi:MAG: ABC-2 family transporter protein [Acidobacteriota bacterium]